MVRVGLNLTAVAAPQFMLTSTFNAQAQQDKVLWAFSYGISDTDMVKAGFGKNTKPRRDHTVLDRAGIVPLGGVMEIESITVLPKILYTPSLLTDVDTRVDDNNASQIWVADWIGSESGGAQLRSQIVNWLDRVLVPFWSYGEGEKRNYLAACSQLVPNGYPYDGRLMQFMGAPLVLNEKIRWRNKGDSREFRVGFEIRVDEKNEVWVAPATSPATSAGRAILERYKALGITSAGNAATADGLAFATLDLQVLLHGYRKELEIDDTTG
jgi:hypothetical protein